MRLNIFISMFSSILTFDFDLILGSVLVFWALMAYFWGWGKVQNCFGSTHKAEKFLFSMFSMFPLLLTFTFDLILGSLLAC